nr:ATP synthase F0 subunit 6 [Nogodinidae sp.]
MMTSYFSPFDPSSMKMQMNWMMMMMPMMILPMNFWMKKSRWIMTKKKMENMMMKELMIITHHKEIFFMTKSFFLMFLLNNMMGLFPYMFTPTGHILLSMAMALPMWMMLMIYGWMKFTNMMFMHLLPMGTLDLFLQMLMMIETTGNMFRPISLSLRLTANMIAGHLLMTLLENLNELKMMFLFFQFKMYLMKLKSAISLIQAYVFPTQLTFYLSEIP